MYSVLEHVTPATLGEALALLASGRALRPVAGGTDLLVKLRHTMQEVSLLQVGQLQELQGVKVLTDGTISIGAACTFTGLAKSPVILESIPVLAQAALAMGGPQIRNVATVGGNLCNGAVSADSAPGLLALGAQVQLASAAKTRTVTLEEFYQGPGKVDLRADELMVRILVPPRPAGEGGCYLKYSMRGAMDIATLGVAAVCTQAGDGRFHSMRLAAGVMAKTPLRLLSGEAAAVGAPANEETAARVAEAALTDTSPRTSWRATKEFREHIFTVYCRRAILEAAGRAQR